MARVGKRYRSIPCGCSTTRAPNVEEYWCPSLVECLDCGATCDGDEWWAWWYRDPLPPWWYRNNGVESTLGRPVVIVWPDGRETT